MAAGEVDGGFDPVTPTGADGGLASAQEERHIGTEIARDRIQLVDVSVATKRPQHRCCVGRPATQAGRNRNPLGQPHPPGLAQRRQRGGDQRVVEALDAGLGGRLELELVVQVNGLKQRGQRGDSRPRGPGRRATPG